MAQEPLQIPSRDDLTGTHKELLSINRELQLLESQEDALQTVISHRHAFIAPIRRISEDILSTIFLTHSSSGNSPWKLLGVCRLWRNVATTTPRLWSSFSIEDHPWYHPNYITPPNYWQCRTAGMLRRGLEWARASPLDVRFEMREQRWGTDVPEDILEMMSMLYGRISQCRKLEFIDLTTVRGAEDGRWETTFSPALPSLEHLHLLFDIPSLRQSLDQQPPSNLHTVHLEPGIDIKAYASVSWWPSVQNLTIGEGWGDRSSLATIISACSSLRQVTVYNITDFSPLIYRSTHLTHVTLENRFSQISGTFPHLTHLTIRNRSTEGLVTGRTQTDTLKSQDYTHFPALRILHFESSQYKHLRGMHAPRLHTLTLNASFLNAISWTGPVVESEVRDIFLPEGESSNDIGSETERKLPQPILRPSHTLRLVGFLLSLDTLKEFIRMVGDQVQELELAQVYNTKYQDFYKSFHLPKTTRRIKEPTIDHVLGRNVRRLEIDFRSLSSEVIFNDAKVYRSMVGLMENRRECKKPLESFRAQFTTLFGGALVDVGRELEFGEAEEKQPYWSTI